MAGSCIEFRSGSFNPEWTWNRWRRGGLTFFSGVPTIYTRLMRYFEAVIAKQTKSEIESYEVAAQAIGVFMCGSSALPRPLQQFWTKLRGEKAILARYGSTEVGAILKVPLDSKNVPDGSVGIPSPGSDIKLSEGDHGEILVKCAYMLSKYLYDDDATSNSFDADGYFKTGDIARKDGKYYFIVGRASQDIIKSGGYKISALDIERELLSLPYISEAIVVGVEDEEFGQRVGAVITLRDDQELYTVGTGRGKPLDLETLRNHLGSSLARYKLPTLLRILEGELPKTASGKVLKKILGPQLFPVPGYDKIEEVMIWRSNVGLIAKL